MVWDMFLVIWGLGFRIWSFWCRMWGCSIPAMGVKDQS